VSLLAAIATAAAALPGAAPAALTPPVADVAARAPERELRVIVQQRPGTDLSEAIARAGGDVEREVALIDGLVVRLPAARAPRVAALPGVESVSLDAPVESLSTADEIADDLDDRGLPLATAYNQSIRSHRAWRVGLTGQGVGVAVIDTGIQGDLPDFQRSRTDGQSRVAVSAVVNPAAEHAGDGLGHGTHIAGLIAGNGFNRPFADPLRGRYVGVAPGAHLIAIKAGDDAGNATVLDVIDGLQFAVDHARHFGIRIVNLSLSSTVAESHLTDPLDAAAEAAWHAGLVVVTAAGNRGGDDEAVHYAPANDPWVITVGAVDDLGTRMTRDDALASWSSRGVTQDGHAKPDVLAPGARMVSTIGAGAAYREQCPTCIVDGDYFRVGGTSMAAAVASGAAALILQAHPHWNPDRVKRALTRRTRPVLAANERIRVDALGQPLPDDVTRASTVVGGEIAVDKVLRDYADAEPLAANRDLPLNTLLDPVTGGIDYTRTSWTRTSWTEAVWPLRTSWTLSDWMRTSWTRTSWTASESSCVDLERTSWTRTSWTAEELADARAQCDALLAAADPTRTSWTRTSWTRTSWTTSFSK
jgi:serine protease AprX